MLSIYPACFFEEENGGYSVVFPDLNYLATQGDTKTEAFEMAVDCLAGYLYTAQRDGESVPAVSKRILTCRNSRPQSSGSGTGN